MLFLSTPFSTWIGGSVQMLSTYVQSEWPMLLVMGGLAASWAEVEILISTMTLTAFASLVMAKVLLQERGGRLELDLRGGSISNSNDLAAQLLLLMPFMLLIAFNPKKNVVYRLLAISGSALATYMILGSASRGAMVSLGAMALLLFFLANGAKKLLALLLLPLVLIGVFVSLSGTAQRRLLNFSTTNSAGDNFETQEAIDSARSRSYIFMKSLQYTFEHPFLGVGPGQVNSYDGQVSVREGRARGHWMGTHNSYTMISSECGIPAFLFFTGALILSFTTMNGIRKTCGYREDLAHIKRVVEAMMLSQMGFYVAITFLTIGYRNTLPAMGGLAIVVAITARAEIYRIDKAKQEAQTATLPVNPLTGRVTPVLATAPAAPQPQWVAQSGRPRLNPKFGRG